MKIFPILILCAVCLFPSSQSIAADDAKKLEAGQHEMSLEKEITRTVNFKYLLHLPEGYNGDTEKEWPLIVFLHGMGERGDNLDKVKEHGPPKIVEGKDDFPFVVVSPQCTRDRLWVTEDLAVFLDGILEEYRVDEDRVYLTGLSMGGFGTWKWAGEQPDRFAAIAPICGGGEPLMARRLRKTPIWAFHGSKDSVVPVRRTEEMIEALERRGGEPKVTYYPEAGHDSWTETYNNPELYDWFLSHTR